MKTKGIVIMAVFGALTLSQLALFAQAGPPGPGSGAPIDGGAALLIAGVAAYGYRKIRKSNAKINDEIAYFESVVQDYEKNI